STATPAFYSSITQALGSIPAGTSTSSILSTSTVSSTTTKTSTTLTISIRSSTTTTGSISTSTSLTTTISNNSAPQFANGNNIVLILPSLVWVTPTNTTNIGIASIGTTGV